MEIFNYMVLIYSFYSLCYNFYQYYSKCKIKKISTLILKTIKYERDVTKHIPYLTSAIFFLALFVTYIIIIF